MNISKIVGSAMNETIARSTIFPCSVAADIIRRGGSLSGDSAEKLEMGLRLLSVIPPDASLILYRDVTEWIPGGAETYISTFEIEFEAHSIRHTRKCIAKAVLSMGNIAAKGREWMERGNRLNQYEVKTPANYSFWEGILFQQFIEHDFADFFERSPSGSRQRFAEQLLQLAHRVDAAGFNPISLVSDLRTDGEILYITDVGIDLGHFETGAQGGDTAYSQAHKWLKSKVENFDG